MKAMISKNVNEGLLIGVDFTNGRDKGVLIVGRKNPKANIDIVNAFQGEEAWELYQKLITKKEAK